tara:strand:- start:1105 stop:1875 length:771 start_codon:yes stop_codon:yes gene_type:complete
MANFPIYIISKGRAYNPLTAKNFIREGLDFYIAVEPQEYEDYVNALGEKNVLKLPFSNLGVGSYPARNFCWEHSKKNGFEYHWLFDDNITNWTKWVNGKRRKWNDIDVALKFVEILTIKHKIDILGFEEPNFVVKPPKKPFKFNCHVYSAMLIKNKLPYRWRLKYNEDVDLCLQVLHNGGTTASCIYYMADKVSTVSKMKGGNQTELYKGNAPIKNLLKAKTLEAQWPQYAKTVIRFGRHHHLVDWKQFKKKSKKK